jgi:hypothetical protein
MVRPMSLTHWLPHISICSEILIIELNVPTGIVNHRGKSFLNFDRVHDPCGRFFLKTFPSAHLKVYTCSHHHESSDEVMVFHGLSKRYVVKRL